MAAYQYQKSPERGADPTRCELFVSCQSLEPGLVIKLCFGLLLHMVTQCSSLLPCQSAHRAVAMVFTCPLNVKLSISSGFTRDRIYWAPTNEVTHGQPQPVCSVSPSTFCPPMPPRELHTVSCGRCTKRINTLRGVFYYNMRKTLLISYRAAVVGSHGIRHGRRCPILSVRSVFSRLQRRHHHLRHSFSDTLTLCKVMCYHLRYHPMQMLHTNLPKIQNNFCARLVQSIILRPSV